MSIIGAACRSRSQSKGTVCRRIKDSFQIVYFSLCSQGDYRHQCSYDCTYLTRTPHLELVVDPKEGGEQVPREEDMLDHLSLCSREHFFVVSS